MVRDRLRDGAPSERHVERGRDLRDLRWAHARARIAARKGDAAEARKQTAVVKALVDKGCNPDQAIQYPYLAGYVDFYLKDYAGAIAELQQADARDPFIQVLLAQALEKSGQAASAREHYRKVLESNAHSPNNASPPFARRSPARRKRGPDRDQNVRRATHSLSSESTTV